MPNETPMSPDEAAIISGAVENALCWGTGIITTCREALEMYDYTFTTTHEQYIFENYIDND